MVKPWDLRWSNLGARSGEVRIPSLEKEERWWANSWVVGSPKAPLAPRRRMDGLEVGMVG